MGSNITVIHATKAIPTNRNTHVLKYVPAASQIMTDLRNHKIYIARTATEPSGMRTVRTAMTSQKVKLKSLYVI